MPESYTQVQNMFDFPGVLNAKMQDTAAGTGNATEKLLLTRYSDGRLEFDGSFYITVGQTIVAADILIDLSNKEFFPELIAPPTIVQIWVENAGLKVGAAQFDNTNQDFFFETTSDILTLVDSLRYYIRGTIVPQNVKSLPAYLWGG